MVGGWAEFQVSILTLEYIILDVCSLSKQDTKQELPQNATQLMPIVLNMNYIHILLCLHISELRDCFTLYFIHIYGCLYKLQAYRKL